MKPMKGAKMLPLVGVRFDVDAAFFAMVREAITSGRPTVRIVDAIPDAERETYRLRIEIAPPDAPADDSVSDRADAGLFGD